jgi:uncharacterized protein
VRKPLPNTHHPSPITRAIRAACVACLALAAQGPKLEPSGYTTDAAGVLSPQGIERLNRLAGEVQQKTRAQMAIVLIRSLQGEPIEDYSINLARRWGVGQKKENTGVLLLLVVDDYRMRVEVGYGLEPVLPDGRVGAILRSMRPALRENRYDDAVWQAAGQIAGVLAESAGVTLGDPTLPRPPPRQRSQPAGPALPLWVLGLGGLGALWLFWKVGFNPLWLLGSLGGGGGGDGGGGRDGGGFGGFGGGDFGGGGASSDW